MSTVQASVTLQLGGSHNLVSNGVNYNGQINNTLSYSLTAPDITKVYNATLPVTTTTTLTLDDGSLTNAYGEAVSFTNVLVMVLENDDASKTFTVGGGTAAFLPAQTITANGFLASKSTTAVSGTNDKLKLAVTGTASISVLLLGN